MKRRLSNSLFSTLFLENRSLHEPKFEAFKLLFLKLSSSLDFYTKQYHMKQIRLPRHLTRWPRLPSFRDLFTNSRWLYFCIAFALARGYSRSDDYAFLYRLSPPEAIHGLVAMLLLHRLPSFEAIQDLSDSFRMTSFLRHFWHSSLVSGSFEYNWCIASSIHDDWLSSAQ